jgi:hypothetical protein
LEDVPSPWNFAGRGPGCDGAAEDDNDARTARTIAIITRVKFEVAVVPMAGLPSQAVAIWWTGDTRQDVVAIDGSIAETASL